MPELADQTLVVNGVAKTYAMTGWRVGWMIGPADVIAASVNLQSHTTSNVGNVAQRAALAAVSGDLTAVDAMRQVYDRRRQSIVSMLHRHPRRACAPSRRARSTPSRASRACSAAPIRGRTAGAAPSTLAALLLDEAKVAVVPGEAFGAPGYVRFSYALADDDWSKGVTRIGKLLAEAQSLRDARPGAGYGPGGLSAGRRKAGNADAEEG